MQDGIQRSASMRLSMDMTVREAISGMVAYLSLPGGDPYRLLRQCRLLEAETRLFEAGVQEGDILQLTVVDANTTIGALNLGRSMAGGVLSRLGGKAGEEPLSVRAALVTAEGKSFRLYHTRALIGRADEKLGYPSETLDVDLTSLDPDRVISRPHAMIVYAEGGFTLRDLYSQGGVEVNGERLSPSGAQPIYDGDVLMFGGIALQFRCE